MKRHDPSAASAPGFDPDAFLRRLWQMDSALVAAGFPGISPWWRTQIERFIRSGCRRWVIRAGRRAGKSTTLCRLAVAWAWFGPWSVPPGDVAVVPFVSVSRDEASARLRTIADVLRALGLGFEQRADEIELGARRVVFRVHACTVRSVVGFTSIAVFGDEVARWEDRETAANPARAIVSSLAPSLATQPHGFMVLSSSPWLTDDFHATSFDRGDTEHQITSFAETWTANPTLTEEATRALEPDEATWLREYAAQPSDAVSANWFGAAVDSAIDAGRTGPLRILDGVHPVISVDQAFASGGDRFGWAIVTSEAGDWDPDAAKRGPRRTVVHEVGAWRPDRAPREMALRFRNEVLARYRQRHVYIDQFAGAPFAQLCRDVGLTVTIVPWTGGDGADAKATRYRAVRLGMADGSVRIPDDPHLIRELRSVRGVLTPSGNERIEVPRTAAGHGDRVSAMVHATSIALAGPAYLAPSRRHWIEEQLERDRWRAFELLGAGGSGSF